MEHKTCSEIQLFESHRYAVTQFTFESKFKNETRVIFTPNATFILYKRIRTAVWQFLFLLNPEHAFDIDLRWCENESWMSKHDSWRFVNPSLRWQMRYWVTLRNVAKQWVCITTIDFQAALFRLDRPLDNAIVLRIFCPPSSLYTGLLLLDEYK